MSIFSSADTIKYSQASFKTENLWNIHVGEPDSQTVTSQYVGNNLRPHAGIFEKICSLTSGNHASSQRINQWWSYHIRGLQVT